MKFRCLRPCLFGALALSASLVTWAFVVLPIPLWPDGTVRLQLKLGGALRYSDSTTPNETAIEAAKVWNRFMARLQLIWSTGNTSAPGGENSLNEVAFTSSIYGYSFGPDVLAVALISSNDSQRTEADVLVNQAIDWDSYRGPLRPDAIDLRRVLVHEFGHVLGLGHPDQAGEAVSSVMNAYVGNVEAPTIDDQDGVGSLYGRGPDNPAILPRLNELTPFDRSLEEGQTAQFFVEITGGSKPFQFQWHRNDVAIPGATKSLFELPNLKLADAGRYHVVVANDAGTVRSREATLTVTPATRPVFGGEDTLVEMEVGGAMRLTVSAGGTSPITYQWRKDGVDIPGATSDVYAFAPATAQHAGSYTARATNVAGSAVSPTFKIMVLPVAAPPSARVLVSYGTWTGRPDQLTAEAGYGSQLYSYQWYRNGVLIPGATARTLEIEPSSGPAEYHVMLRNATGATSSTGRWYVPERPVAPPNPAGWSATARQGDVAYFLFANPARVERYDLAGARWLAPLDLDRPPLAFAVDASGLFIAFAEAVVRFGLDGKNPVTVFATGSEVADLLIGHGFLYAFVPVPSPYGLESRFLAAPLSNLSAVVESRRPGLSNPATGSLSLHLTKPWLFGRDRSSSGRLLRAEIGSDGSIGSEFADPFQREYPSAGRTFVTRDGAHVFDDGGTVFRTSDLRQTAAFGRRFEDVVQVTDGTYVTVGFGELVQYDPQFRAMRRHVAPAACTRVFVTGTTLVAFAPPSAPGGPITAVRVPLAAFQAPSAAPSLDPLLAAQNPAQVLQDARGVVHLLDRSQRAIFRWSPAVARYVDIWPLSGVANVFSYSPTRDVFLVSYADGRLSTISATGAETPVITLPDPAQEVVALGERMLLRDSYGTNVFGSDGQLLESDRRDYSGTQFLFNGVSQRLFYVEDSGLGWPPNSRPLQADGTLGPVANATGRSNRPVQGLRLSADSTKLGTLSGDILAADSLATRFALPHGIGDLAWLGRTLFTARDTLEGIVVERWNDTQTVDATRRFGGRLLRLLITPDNQLLLIALRGGTPFFVPLDETLQGAEPTQLVFDRQPTGGAAPVGGSITLSAAAAGNPGYQWSRDGVVLPDRRASSCSITGLQPAASGLYAVTVASPTGTGVSDPAIVGVTSNGKVTGAAAEIAGDIRHPNGNSYDQVLLSTGAAAITADPGQVTRTSFIDTNGDIVQVEFAGAGTLALVIADASDAGPPRKYQQPAVNYVSGRVSLVITDADETTHASVFSVGRATAYDPTGGYDLLRPPGPANSPANNGSPLFTGHDTTAYDGIADIGYVAVVSRNGRFGSLRLANARLSATAAFTGIYAPGVQFSGPVFVGEIAAHGAAQPLMILGEVADIRITGGSLDQSNGRPVKVSGISRLQFTDGTDSHGRTLSAQRNRARLEQNGADVTDQIVVNP